MSERRAYAIKRVVRPILQFQKEALGACERALSDEDRFLWSALPKLANALGRSEMRIKEEIQRRPLGGIVAPVLESAIASQALVFDLAIEARSHALRAGAKVAGKCAAAADEAIERVKE